MDLITLVTSTPALLTLAEANDLEGLAAALNEQNIRIDNHTKIGPISLPRLIGVAAAQAACGYFDAVAQLDPLMKARFNTFCVEGFDFSDQDCQDGIDLLVTQAGMPAELGAALKAVGRTFVSLAQQHLGGAVTEEDLAGIPAALAKRAAANWWQAAVASLSVRVSNGEFSSAADIKQAFSELV